MNQMEKISGGFFTGINYWGLKDATQMWEKYDDASVEEDMKALRGADVTHLRVFPLWPVFQPLTALYTSREEPYEYRFGEEPLPNTDAGRAGVSEEACLRFENFCALAEKYGLKLIVGLITGHMSFRNFAPPAFAGRRLVGDPTVLKWQLRFVRYFVRDDISHGVTKVLLSVSKQKSIIAPHNIWSSVGASAMTIGFGGSVGAEAPIVYSGAAIGSNIARALKLPYKDVTILLGCGAASAIAGIFSAPLAGVLFTLEILLFNISMSSILTLLLSSVTATVVSYIFTGTSVSFPSTLQEFSMGNLPFYLLLGIFCGAMSLYFMRTSLWLEDKMRNIRRPMTRWILCAAMLGLLIFSRLI